jgi:hypothetical protein
VLADHRIEEQRQTIVLEQPWCDIFMHCDEIRGEDDVVTRFADRVPPAEITAFLERMIAARLLYRSPSRQLINLPLMKEIPDVAEIIQPRPSRPVERRNNGGVGLSVLG